MIRHIALFRLKDGWRWDSAEVLEAERIAGEVGQQVPDLRSWYAGRNISERPVAYDFVVIGLVDDEAALNRYLVHPFHQKAIAQWRAISDWVVADVVEETATRIGTHPT
jgi:hypothetical protein